MMTMFHSITYYAQWAWAGLFGVVIAWWVWAIIAIAVAIAALLMLPPKLGQVAAVLIIIAGLCTSAFSFGNNFGANLEYQKWQRMLAAESLRLQEEADKQVGEERLRTASAESERDNLKGTVDELTEAALKAPGVGDIVVSEPVARSLRDWTSGRGALRRKR